MSFGDGLPRQFLEPMKGKTAAFRLNGRSSNLKFAAAVVGLLAGALVGCRILDLDAFYSSNLETLAAVAGRVDRHVELAGAVLLALRPVVAARRAIRGASYDARS